jgi:hypothetical protein
MRTFRGFIQVAGLAVAGFAGHAGAASAQVINTDVGLNDAFSQTSDSTATETGAFFPLASSFPRRANTQLAR